ncbi:MAG: serine/threonine protein kinase [Elusimicrobia bacterium]|nr:serine/threonine protein kinase [Elusimicrobiota bacterium]
MPFSRTTIRVVVAAALLVGERGAVALAGGTPPATALAELEREARPLLDATASRTEQLKELTRLYADDADFPRLSERRQALRGALLSILEPLEKLEQAYETLLKQQQLGAVAAGLTQLMDRRGLRSEAGAEVARALARERFAKELSNVRRQARWVLENDDVVHFSVSDRIAGRRRNWKLGFAGALAALSLAGCAFWLGGRRAGGDVGVVAGTYRLGRELGHGAMGRVYEAVDVALSRKVAVKKIREELASDPVELNRFLVEARLVAALKHPNIVEIYSVMKEGLELSLVFEFVDGRPLSSFLRERGRLPLDLTRRLLAGIGEAIDYAHGRGVIHRDLKPSNVMVGYHGEPKVMDFGIAHQARESIARLTRTEAIGTRPYMAPEAELGLVGRESDIFSLGVCVYEMLTGMLPFPGPDFLAQKRERSFRAASEAVAGLPPGLDRVLSRALHPEPQDRFHGAGELVKAFDDALG